MSIHSVTKIPTIRHFILSMALLVTMLIGFSCSSGSEETTPTTSQYTPPTSTVVTTPTSTIPKTSTMPTTSTTATTTPTTSAVSPTTVSTPTTTAAGNTTTKPTTSTTRTTDPKPSTLSTAKPTHLTVDIEQLETSGFKIVWLRPLNDIGSIQIVEGTVNAKLWLIKDGEDKLINTWENIPFGPDNYTLISKGAEVAFPYPNEEEHDYDEPGNLEVTLILKDGTKLTTRLEKISLHPTAIT